MIYCLPSVALRSLFGVLLLAALGGCTIFHPYRIPTPKPSPEFKAQQKAAKARKKNNEPSALFKKRADVEEAATDVSTPTGGTVRTPQATAEARTLPNRPTVSYDKSGLLKKPKLMRRRRTKPAPKPFRPWKSIRNFFKYKRHGKPNYSPDHRPAAPASAAEPDAAPSLAPTDVAPTVTPAKKPAAAPTTVPTKATTDPPTAAPAGKSKP